MKGILSIITYWPLIGAMLILFFVNKKNTGLIKTMSTFFAGTNFILSLFLWMNFDRSPVLGTSVQGFSLWDLEGNETRLSEILREYTYAVVEFGSFT